MRENQINNTSFISQEELASKLTKIDLREEQYEAGGVPLYIDGNNAYVDASDTHTLIYGATGSRKSRAIVMPMIEILLRANESFIVTDTKGEIFDRTARTAKEKGYEVVNINLRYPKYSIGWNPIALPYYLYHTGNITEAINMAEDIADMICSDNDLTEKFWAFGAKDILAGFILALIDKTEEKYCTIESLVSFWNMYVQDKEKVLKILQEQFKDNFIISSRINPLFSKSEKTVGSFEAIVSADINKVALNLDVMKLLSSNDLKIDSLKERKLAIYLIVPDENSATHFVASLFIKQMYQVLIAEASQNQNRLTTRMNFVLDEFGNIPRIQDMSSLITAARSRNIRFFLVAQGKNQLISKYREEADTIIGNCSNMMYLYSREYDLLNEISKLCGVVICRDGIQKPLIEPFELQHLSKEECECLVLSQRNYPCIVNLADIDNLPFPKREPLEQIGQYRQTYKFELSMLLPTENELCNNILMKELISPITRFRNDQKLCHLIGTYRGNVVAEGIAEDTDFYKKNIYYKIHGTIQDFNKVKWEKEDIYKTNFSGYKLKSLLGNKDSTEIYDYIEESQEGSGQCLISVGKVKLENVRESYKDAEYEKVYDFFTSECGMLDAYLIANHMLEIVNNHFGKVIKYSMKAFSDNYLIYCKCEDLDSDFVRVIDISWL